MIVDSHAHIDGPEFDQDRDEVIQRARAAGVSAILNVGTGDPHSGAFERAITLAEGNQDIYAAIGVHPHDARLFDDDSEKKLIALVQGSSRVIAWGEIGLDFHYDNSPRDIQMRVFRRQLQLARETQLPVIVHTRAAEAETIDALQSETKGTDRSGVMHCFSGSLSLAQRAIELGFYISFSGVITFKKAADLRAVALQVPLDKLLVETDCPYLAPVPHRGKRNEPAYVMDVARSLAELRGTTVEELARITSANFGRLFQVQLSR